MTKHQINSMTDSFAIETIDDGKYSIKYKVVKNLQAFKIGYCCDEVGVPFPLLVKINTDEDNLISIYLSKNGIYEVQSEDTGIKSKENPPMWITEVHIPFAFKENDSENFKIFNFVFDYYSK